MTEVKIRSTQEVVETTDTSQTIDISGFGTVKGVRFRWGQATADGTSAAHAVKGRGYASFEGTGFQWCATSLIVDNADPSRSLCAGNQAACIQFWDPTGTPSINLTGTVTRHTDGITITWSATPGTAFRMEVTLYGGADFMCEAGVEISNLSPIDVAHNVTAVDMTEEPEWVEFAHAWLNPLSTTTTADAFFSEGYGSGPTASITQASVGYNDDDGRGPASRHGVGAASDRVLVQPNYTAAAERQSWELTALTTSGGKGRFTLVKRTGSAASSYGWFMCSTGGNNANYVGLDTLDTTTSGDTDYTSPGFQPQWASFAQVGLTGAGFDIAGGEPDRGISASAIDATGADEGSYIGASDEVDPSAAYSRFDSDFIHMRTAGDAGDLHVASFVSMLSTGFRFNVATTGTARAAAVLCVEEDSASDPDITSALVGTATLPDGITGVGTVESALVGDAALPDGVTGVGTLETSIVGTATLADGVSGVGSLTSGLVGDAALPDGVTGVGTVESVMVGTATLPDGLTGLSNEIESTLVADAALASALTGVGTIESALAGDAVLPDGITGIGTLESGLVATATVPDGVSGSGTLATAAVGTATLTGVLSDGVGSLTTAEVGTATLPDGVTGVGTLETAAVGTATLPDGVTGVGTLASAMEGTATVPDGLTGAGSGDIISALVATATVPDGITGIGTLVSAMVGDAVLPDGLTAASNPDITSALVATATLPDGITGVGTVASAMAATATLTSNLTGVGTLETPMVGTATATSNLGGIGSLLSALVGDADLPDTLTAIGSLATAVVGDAVLAGDLVDGNTLFIGPPLDLSLFARDPDLELSLFARDGDLELSLKVDN